MNTNAEINWDQLALVVGDDSGPADEEMVDLYRLFVDDAARRLESLAAPVPGLDLPLIAKEAHKIRGAASSFGFDSLSDLLRQIETQINQLERGRIEAMLREALGIFSGSVQSVATRFPRLAA